MDSQYILRSLISKGDPLYFVFRIHQTLFCNKLLSPIVYGSCFVYTLAGILSTIHLSIHDGNDFLKKYSVVPSTMPWAITTAFIEYYWIQPGIIYHTKINLDWDVLTASPQGRSEIRRQIKIARVTCTLFILQSLINSIVGFLIGFISDIRSDIHSIDILFTDHLYIKIFLYIISNISHSVVTLISISFYLALKYFATTTKIQLKILADFFDGVRLYKNTENEAINEHLKVCSIHHDYLLDKFTNIQQIFRIPLIPSSTAGSVAIFGCLISIDNNRHILDVAYISLLLSLVLMISLDCCQSGQDVVDAFAEFSTNLTKIEWYQWNETNKKVLLFMLMRSQKDAQITALNISLNRTLIIQIVKSAYQIFVVLKGRI